jgi:ferric-dicitrate binding protein FerR (iron transport regulator)
MELEPKHISELISKYLIGKLSEEERETLDNWMVDPYNQLQFDKITNAQSFLDKVEKYDKYNAKKAWKKIEKSKRKSLRVWLAYAAVTIIPLCIGALILEMSTFDKGENYFSSHDIEISSDEIMLSTNDGDYVLGKSDTTLFVDDVNIKTDSEQLSYSSMIASKSSPKLVYNTLKTPKGGKYKLVLSDGTVVWLNSETKFRYPVNFIADKREVFVEEGEVFFDVVSNKKKPFIVNFNDKKVQVLGTEFNVKSYDDEENDLITLVEGSIKLITEHSTVELLPNQQAVVNKSNNNMQIKPVEALFYTAWKDNIYLYKSQTLNTIITDLERDFDIKVFYQNEDLKNEKFSLKISRKHSFEAIFSALEKTHEIDIEINNNIIVLRKK